MTDTAPGIQAEAATSEPVRLRRVLSLPLLTLYGLGVTLGAGIYVLVGVTVERAGIHAPLTFVLASCVVAFTCLSYAELSTRFPVSAGEAEYLHQGFRSRILSTVAGLLLVTSGTVSSAAIAIGAANYLGLFISAPEPVLVAALILVLALAACWGIAESLFIAALFTLVEAFGLGMVIWFGSASITDPGLVWKAFTPGFEITAWAGIATGSLLAFFAFVGFEDIVNVAEEVNEPQKTLPRAIMLTLVLATLLYLAVVTTMIAAVPLDTLSGAKAPLALVFQDKPAALSTIFSVIAIIATVNGILIQIIMASRVIYGMSNQGNLPRVFGYVHPRLRTPLIATACVTAIVLILGLTTPIDRLAEATSQAVLVVFVLVNSALLAIWYRDRNTAGEPATDDYFHAPRWAPAAGVLTCLLLLSTSFV